MDLHELFGTALADLPELPDLVPEAERLHHRRTAMIRSSAVAGTAALVIGVGTLAIAGPWDKPTAAHTTGVAAGGGGPSPTGFALAALRTIQESWPYPGQTVTWAPEKALPGMADMDYQISAGGKSLLLDFRFHDQVVGPDDNGHNPPVLCAAFDPLSECAGDQHGYHVAIERTKGTGTLTTTQQPNQPLTGPVTTVKSAGGIGTGPQIQLQAWNGDEYLYSIDVSGDLAVGLDDAKMLSWLMSGPMQQLNGIAVADHQTLADLEAADATPAPTSSPTALRTPGATASDTYGPTPIGTASAPTPTAFQSTALAALGQNWPYPGQTFGVYNGNMSYLPWPNLSYQVLKGNVGMFVDLRFDGKPNAAYEVSTAIPALCTPSTQALAPVCSGSAQGLHVAYYQYAQQTVIVQLWDGNRMLVEALFSGELVSELNSAQVIQWMKGPQLQALYQTAVADHLTMADITANSTPKP